MQWMGDGKSTRTYRFSRNDQINHLKPISTSADGIELSVFY